MLRSAWNAETDPGLLHDPTLMIAAERRIPGATRRKGVTAMPPVTLDDLSLKGHELTPRVSALRDNYFKAMPEICVERARLVTRFSLDNDLLKQPRISVLDKARTYRYVLEHRDPVVRHSKAYAKGMKPFTFKEATLFAGSTTSKFKGVPLYPEFLALTLWPELWSVSARTSNPYQITDAEREDLNRTIFPAWMDHSILELTRKQCYEDNWEKYGKKKHAPEIQLLSRLGFFMASKPNCISHTIPDFSRAIKFGLRAMIDDAAQKAGATDDPRKQEFYKAVTEVLEGLIAYSRRLAAKAQELAAAESDPELKQELKEIAEINKHVPEFPARTFREALTTVWLCWVAIHLENPNVGLSLGRLDQVLYEAYEKDIKAGTLDVGTAVELICCLWLKIGDHVPTVPDTGEQLFGGTGSNQAITIGGVDMTGKDAVNDLTYVMLKATELMRLRDPNLNARYFQGENSPAYLRRLCEVNVTTGATPALHNDKAVIKALTSKGDSLEHARDYGVTGCVEPGSNGRFYGHTGALLINLTSALELTLFNGRHRHSGMHVRIGEETGDPTTFATFDDFKAAFETQTRWLVEQAVALNNCLGKAHQRFYPTPILSSFFEGPVAKGCDLIDGGAVINASGASIIGLADVADSLSAIERVIYKDKVYDMASLVAALVNNFEGYEALQKRLANPEKTPKYGNEDAAADANVTWIAELLDGIFGEYTNYRGGNYRVGYWTMTNHAGFGRLMPAQPNGRKAGENFASGITPVSGATPYLTKTLNSVAKLPVRCLADGVALNIKYTPETGDREKMLDNFVASVEGYFSDDGGTKDGGMEIQFNVTNHAKFEEAFHHPEKHPELLVRVSGYTAYFKDLNRQMQKEIIDRTEYDLSTGKAVFYPPFELPPTDKEPA
jgi:pyruvate formate-lyase/glycerol dehydratase family glycyl radical enzyme